VDAWPGSEDKAIFAVVAEITTTVSDRVQVSDLVPVAPETNAGSSWGKPGLNFSPGNFQPPTYGVPGMRTTVGMKSEGDPDSIANWVQTRFGEGKMALETIMLMIRSMRMVFEPP